MKFLCDRRLWMLICEFLTLHEVAISLPLSSRRLLHLLDDEEVWGFKLRGMPWHRSNETLLTSAKTAMRLYYMKSTRAVDYICKRLCTYSHDFRQRKFIVHLIGIPPFYPSTVCVLRNGNVFGYRYRLSFEVFDVHVMSLVHIAQPKKHEETMVAASGPYHVYVVVPRCVMVYSLKEGTWSYVDLPDYGQLYNAMRYKTQLFVVYDRGVLEVDVTTWQPTFTKFTVHMTGYTCSFLSGPVPIVVRTDLIIIGMERMVTIQSNIFKLIPRGARVIKEDKDSVYFGKATTLFKYVKSVESIECVFWRPEDVDNSLAATYRVPL